MAIDESNAHIYLTLDDEDENQVLELVLVDGPDYYIRQGGEWVQTDAEADNPRIWDRQIIDVEPAASAAYDAAEAAGEPITLDLFEDFEIPFELESVT